MKILIATPDQKFAINVLNCLLGYSSEHRVSILDDPFDAVKALLDRSIRFDIVILDMRGAWPPAEHPLTELLHGNPLGEVRFIFITHYDFYPEITLSERVISHFSGAIDVSPGDVIKCLSGYEESLRKAADKAVDASL